MFPGCGSCVPKPFCQAKHSLELAKAIEKNSDLLICEQLAKNEALASDNARLQRELTEKPGRVPVLDLQGSQKIRGIHSLRTRLCVQRML